jgi:hypothetical protein
MANALVLNTLGKEASLLHIEPPEVSLTVRFRIDGRWHDEVELTEEMATAVMRRLKIMASVPPHGTEAAVSPIFIQLGMDDDEVHQFVVHVRPSQLGQRLLVRVVTGVERRRMLWPERPGAAEAEEKLRWDRERLFRIAGSKEREVVEPVAREFLAAAESLLPGAQRQVLEVRALLADLTDAAGATSEAVAELEEAIALARAFDAPPMSTSVLVERLAMLREKGGDFTRAVEDRREVLRIVRDTLDADDPYIAGVLGRLADSLVAAGRIAEAEAMFDEAIHLLSELTGDDDQELRDLVSARSRATSAS